MTAFDASELRRHLANHEPFLRTNASRTLVCNAAHNIARDIGDPELVALALALPTARPPSRFAATLPDARDTQLDESIEAFVIAAHAVLDKREDQERRVAANAHLSRADCRDRVLAFLAKDRDRHWVQEVASGLDLSYEQTLDAFEQLEHERALDGRKIATLDERTPWVARLNAHGRNLADGSAQPARAPIVLQQTFHNSNIANAGVTHGPVTQNVTINAEIAEVIKALQQLQAAAEESAETAAVATLASQAQEELRDNGWSAKAGGLLIGIGGLVQTAAALKPAYNTLQPIAVAHRIPLPPWP